MPLLEKIFSRFVRSSTSDRSSRFRQYFETNPLVSWVIFLATVAAIGVVAFVGVSTISLPVQPNQLVAVRITAADSFSYESQILTRHALEQVRTRTPPVFRMRQEPLLKFSVHVRSLLGELEAFDRQFLLGVRQQARAEVLQSRKTELQALLDQFNNLGGYRLMDGDVATLLLQADAPQRRTLFENGLNVLRELYADGVYQERRDITTVSTPQSALYIFHVKDTTGEILQTRVQSKEEALTSLRIQLSSEGPNRDLSLALFRVFKNGILANLEHDTAATARLHLQSVSETKPVVVRVDKGQTIVEPGTRVTDEQHEMLVAHRQHLLRQGDLQLSGNLQLFGRIVLVLAMILGAVFYIRLEDPDTLRSNSRIGLLALVVVLNLALVRATAMLGELPYFVNEPSAGSLLPYLAPTLIAPLIVAVLLGVGPAIFTALVISLFTAVIYGNRLDLLVITFFASVVGIYGCRHARKRSRVVRAGFFSGLTLAVVVALLGYAEGLSASLVLNQTLVSLAVGIATGIAVVGVLPVLESLFRRTTDITLLELTDYNHPLLRLMQNEAPGSYHHSLMVANLAENAAAGIGANPLLCRVCALFHDIGKTARPEYFTENQRDAVNPHDHCEPSFSASVLRGHVSEGVSLALKYRLPRVIIDVIEQHHGTTLMYYFYHRSRSGETPATIEGAFRYEGPKPQFRESALIFFADAVEAASRSLSRVTPEQVTKLVEGIFADRINDGQLDQCPITFAEIQHVKASFVQTLLNMLHTRVAYPKSETQILDHADQETQKRQP